MQTDLLENGDVFENLLRNQGRFALFSENGTCLYAQEGCPETLSFDELMRAANTKNRVCRTADGEKYVVTHKQTKEGPIHVVTLYPAYLLRQGGVMVGCALVSMALGVGIGFVGSFFTIRRHLKV